LQVSFLVGWFGVRPTIYVAAALALVALAPETMRSLLVCAASVLLESLPYLAAGALLAPLFGRHARHLVALAGCGCGDAPGALSLPAAFATALLFGPWVAIVRFAAGALLHIRSRGESHTHPMSLAEELHRLAPSAALCAVVVTFLPRVDLMHVPAFTLFLGGALVGAFATPCVLGGVALAASLHSHSPFAAWGVLCTTGLPITSFLRSRAGLLHGNTVHHSCIRAWRSRLHAVPSDVSRWRVAPPVAILLAIIIGAPAPAYTANENTMSDLYPGERLSFTGAYSRGTLVRYAITCCRADAAPVVIRLAHSPNVQENDWIHASGVIVRNGTMLALNAQRVDRVAPPSDPFLYR
jgi:hypothetical protein